MGCHNGARKGGRSPVPHRVERSVSPAPMNHLCGHVSAFLSAHERSGKVGREEKTSVAVLPMVPTHSLTGSFAVSAWHLGWLAAVGVRCGEGAQAWASCARLGGVCAYADRFGATITAYGTWLPGRARGRDWSAHDICRSIRCDHHCMRGPWLLAAGHAGRQAANLRDAAAG